MDLARIGFSADTSDLKDAKASLEALVPAAKRAENAAKGVTAAARGLAGGIKPFNSAVQQAAAGSTGLSRAALASSTAMGTVQRAAVGAATQVDVLGGSVRRVGMNFAQADAHVEAYKRSLQGVAPAANGAKSALDRLGASANDNINKMQATPGNIAAQFQDIGVTAAAGMSPMIIALQQGTQLSAAMTGGLGNLVRGLAQVFHPVSLLTIAIVGLIAYVIQLGMEMFNAGEEATALEKALDNTRVVGSALGDVQSALGNVIDLTTGKIISQSDALWGLAEAQLAVIEATALRDQTEARKRLVEEATPRFSAMKALTIDLAQGGSLQDNLTTSSSARGLIERFLENPEGQSRATINALRKLREEGKLAEETWLEVTAAVANYGMATENIRLAQGGVDALSGDRGALGQFLTPKKTSSRKGPKTEAEKFSDIITGAQNDIATQQMREQNVALRNNAEALAASEQRQKLLNSAASKGITLTSDMRAAIEELATAYGKASAAADRAEFIFDLGRDADNQMRSLQQARKEIGLYGEALYRARFEREMLNKAEDAGITLTDAEAREFADRAAAMARVAAGTDRGAFSEASRRQHEETMWRLDRERAEIGLTDEALRAHRIETELLAQARQKNIDLTPAEAAALGQYAREQAAAEEAIRRVTDALAEARETARGFFQDWFDGIRNGEGFFNSFANSVLNGLNRIATKMMDRAIDKFLDMMFAGNTTGSTGAGGFLDKVFGSIFGSSLPVIKLAKGGVVDRPTMFAHASGLGQMGEAGPEGVLPLKRGPDGSLGVQVHGGGNSVVNDVKVSNTYHVSGAVTPNDIVRMIRAGSEQTQAEVKRQIMGWLSEIQADGGTV